MAKQAQSVQTITVREKNGRTFLSTYNKVLVGAAAATPLFAFADGLDMSSATTQFALGLAAIGALGAAKLAPSALTWVWGLVTGNARRG